MSRKRTLTALAAGTVIVATSTTVAMAGTPSTESPARASQESATSAADDLGVLSFTRVRQLAKAGGRTAVGGTPRTLAGSASPSPSPSAPMITSPLPPSQCRSQLGSSCLRATDLRHAYGLDKLPAQGAGATVALVLPYVNPYAQHNLDVYSDSFGLPRTKLEVINWEGKAKVADPTDPNQAVAVEEAALDMEMIHALAPRAHIVYVNTATNLLGGSMGLDEVSDAVAWLTDHRHIDVFEASYGSPEDDFPIEAGTPGDYRAISKLRAGFVYAARRGVTLIASDGDNGPTLPGLPNGDLYDHPVAPWPATDPQFTSVSGTLLATDDAGNRLAPDRVWEEHNGNMVATGGATSHVFARPAYQDGVRGVVGSHRGVGDISMVGDVDSRVWVYSEEYNVLSGQAPGWVRTAGTSVSAPLVAGVVADAAGLARHPLGNINPALYVLGRKPAAVTGLFDVTEGCNTITGLQGYCAREGYDLPAGGQTVRSAAVFVPALVAQASRTGASNR